MSILESRLDQLRLDNSAVFQNLAITPLLGNQDGEPDYLTLDEALTQQMARVVEVSESGSVPELRFENMGSIAILLMDGEELVGAKQNRILNLSILVPAKTTITIPVSCVEAGRWAHVSPTFRSEQRAYFAAGRARKATQVTDSLRMSGTRHSRQGEVWEDISTKSERLGSASPTHAMAAMYADHEQTLDQFVAAFAPVAHQVGAIFSIGGNVSGLDVFDYAQTFCKQMPKLVRSYALDAIDAQALVTSSTEEPSLFLNVNDHPPIAHFR